MTQTQPPGGEPTCCYDVCGPQLLRAIPGRAARYEDGGVATARAIATDAWTLADLDARTPSLSLSLDDGFYEHASVAAFSRLSLSLLAFGAPPDLVADTHRAALDEIRHAQIAFTLAGGAVGPGPCPAFAELRAHRTLAALAEETYLDGCVGETLAAIELHAKALTTIAEDEARHAELAWRIVEWAIAAGGDDVRERITRVARVTRER